MSAPARPRRPGAASIRAVVVGASAGGVEALSVLLPALPADFAPAVLVVLHLPRERPSLLVDVFAPRCALPVREAEDKAPVEPGTVTFAPPDYHLLVEADGAGAGAGAHLALSVDAPVHYSRPSVDVLFASAADAYGPHLAAVLLTGANADGAEGVAAVARAGGLTIVQDPDTALAPAMPRSALRATRVDHVLALEHIPGLLRQLGAPPAN